MPAVEPTKFARPIKKMLRIDSKFGTWRLNFVMPGTRPAMMKG
jgi:hypothetical protein